MKSAITLILVCFFSLANFSFATLDLTGLIVSGSIQGPYIGPEQQYSPSTVTVGSGAEFITTVPEEGNLSHTLIVNIHSNAFSIAMTLYPSERDIVFTAFDIHLEFETGDVINLHHNHQWIAQPQVNDSGQVFACGYTILEGPDGWFFQALGPLQIGYPEWVQRFDLSVAHTVIPEPSSLLLVGFGGIMIRRRQSK